MKKPRFPDEFVSWNLQWQYAWNHLSLGVCNAIKNHSWAGCSRVIYSSRVFDGSCVQCDLKVVKRCISLWTFALGQLVQVRYVWRVSWCNEIWHFRKSVKIWMLNLELYLELFFSLDKTDWMSYFYLRMTPQLIVLEVSFLHPVPFTQRERNSIYKSMTSVM